MSQLANRQGSQLTYAIAVAAGAARGRSDNWADANLGPVLDLASRVGADARFLNRSGRVVASTPGFGTHPAVNPARTAIAASATAAPDSRLQSWRTAGGWAWR